MEGQPGPLYENMYFYTSCARSGQPVCLFRPLLFLAQGESTFYFFSSSRAIFGCPSAPPRPFRFLSEGD